MTKSNRKQLKIGIQDIIIRAIIFVEVFPFIMMMGLGKLAPSVFRLIYVYYQRVMIVLLVGVFFVKLQKKQWTKIAIERLYILIIPIYVLMISFINGFSIYTWYSNFAMVMVAFFVVSINEKQLPALIDVVLFILEVLLLVNLYFVIRYPEGMYYSIETRYRFNWILGYKSSLQYYVLPALCFKWVKCWSNKNLYYFYILLAVSAIEAYLCHNTMLVIGCVMLFFLLLLSFIKRTILNGKLLYVIVVVSNIVIVFANQLLLGNRYWLLLLELFGKSTMLTSRVSTIWPNVLRAIPEAIVFGHGVLSDAERVQINGGYAGATHAHNQMLELLFVGGIVLLAIFIGLIFHINKRLLDDHNTLISPVLTSTTFVLNMMITVEVFTSINSFSLWIMIILCFYCKEFDSQMLQDVAFTRKRKRVHLRLFH